MDETVNLRPYLLIFALGFLVLSVAIGLVPLFLEIELPSATGVIILTACAMATAQKFVSDHHRVFSKEERRRMVLLSLLISLVISIALLAGLSIAADGPAFRDSMNEFFHTLSPMFIATIVMIVLGIYLLVLFTAYGWGARLLLKSVKKKP